MLLRNIRFCRWTIANCGFVILPKAEHLLLEASRWILRETGVFTGSSTLPISGAIVFIEASWQQSRIFWLKYATAFDAYYNLLCQARLESQRPSIPTSVSSKLTPSNTNFGANNAHTIKCLRAYITNAVDAVEFKLQTKRKHKTALTALICFSASSGASAWASRLAQAYIPKAMWKKVFIARKDPAFQSFATMVGLDYKASITLSRFFPFAFGNIKARSEEIDGSLTV